MSDNKTKLRPWQVYILEQMIKRYSGSNDKVFYTTPRQQGKSFMKKMLDSNDYR